MGKIEELAQQLRSELENGHFQAGERFPSEYELARRYNVNNKTANKATSLLVTEGFLHRGGRGEGTFVRQTSIFPKMILGFIGPIDKPYYCAILNAFQRAAFSAGCLTAVIAPALENLGATIASLKYSCISGYVSCCYGLIEDIDRPVIYLEDSASNMVYPDYVTSNSLHGSQMMMGELLKRGHHDIVFFNATDNNQDRTTGFVNAMRDSGIANIEERIFTLACEDMEFHCVQMLKKALHNFPHLTAIATNSDDIAEQVIKAMRILKIDWEGKITITGFGKVQGIYDRYPIATIDQHPIILGVETFNALVRKINTGVTQQIKIEPELANTQFIFPTDKG